MISTIKRISVTMCCAVHLQTYFALIFAHILHIFLWYSTPLNMILCTIFGFGSSLLDIFVPPSLKIKIKINIFTLSVFLLSAKKDSRQRVWRMVGYNEPVNGPWAIRHPPKGGSNAHTI